MMTLLITMIVLFIVKFSWGICVIVNIGCVIATGSKHKTPLLWRLIFSVLFGPFYTYFAIKAVRNR